MSDRLVTDDLSRALSLAVAAGAVDHEMYAFVIHGEPIAKARARVGRGGRIYTPGRTEDAERDIAVAVLRGRPARQVGNVAVSAIFYRSNRHRIDVDNLLKTVLDGITKSRRVWDDDSQVTAVLGIVELDTERPRTVVALGRHVSSLPRGEARNTHVCETCGLRFAPHSPNVLTRFCSHACRPRRTLPSCVECGTRVSAPAVKRCMKCHLATRSNSKEPLT